MYAIHRKLITATLALLASGPAVADGYPVFTGKYIGPVAELSAEERAWFQQHWKQMPPEERDAMRRMLREKWRDTPPEARPDRRQELLDRMRESPSDKGRGRGWDNWDEGYGQGYENRRRDPADTEGGRGRGRR